MIWAHARLPQMHGQRRYSSAPPTLSCCMAERSLSRKHLQKEVTVAKKSRKMKTRRAQKSRRRAKRVGGSRKRTSLTTMTLDALISLRDDAERLIRSRALTQRNAIEKQLARISGYVGHRIGTETSQTQYLHSTLRSTAKADGLRPRRRP
jgi:hypothetical protein